MHVYVCIQFKHVSICLCMYAVYACFKVTRCACVRACVCTCNVCVRVVGLKRIVNLPSEYPDANTSCDIIKLAFLAMYYL